MSVNLQTWGRLPLSIYKVKLHMHATTTAGQCATLFNAATSAGLCSAGSFKSSKFNNRNHFVLTHKVQPHCVFWRLGLTWLNVQRHAMNTVDVSVKSEPNRYSCGALSLVSSREWSLPMNCISHSLTLSICTALRSDRSSYSSLRASFSRQKVARPLEASRPAKMP